MKGLVILAICLGLANALSIGEHIEEIKELLELLRDSEPSELRLAGGNQKNIGRIEVFYQGEWYSPCGDDMGSSMAEVVCKQVGFLGARRYGTPEEFDITPIQLLGGYICDGTEKRLQDCVEGITGILFCTSGSAVECQDKPIRLMGSSDDNSGRVEILYDNEWYSPCGDDLDMRTAEVMCKELGFSGVERAGTPEDFNLTSSQIIGGFICDGWEATHTDCVEGFSGNLFCTAGSAVECQTKPIRLMGSSDDNSGRVEILYDNAWYSPCGDDLDMRTAEVMCKELGFSGVERAGTPEDFNLPSSQIIGGFICDGWEATHTDCVEGFSGNLFCTTGSAVECQTSE